MTGATRYLVSTSSPTMLYDPNFLRLIRKVWSYIKTVLFERLGFSDVKSRIIAACNGTEYFLASFAAIVLIEKIGRRKLMFFGSVGQTLTMVLLAILGSLEGNAPADIVSAVLLFAFNSFFAVGWLGMTWLYASNHYLMSWSKGHWSGLLARRNCGPAHARTRKCSVNCKFE